MSDLTLPQRILRKPTNWLVETIYPNGAFWGRNYFNVFERVAQKDRSASVACAMFLQAAMRNENVDSLSVEMLDVTHRGEPVGSFRLTLERIEPKEG